jgi:hypothetical protein
VITLLLIQSLTSILGPPLEMGVLYRFAVEKVTWSQWRHASEAQSGRAVRSERGVPPALHV